MAKIKGTGGNDILFGTNKADVIFGRGGDDTISGGDGNDKISGGKGNDTIYGGDGHDRIDGGKGDDYVDGGDGNDRIDGGKGDDTIYGGAGNDRIKGGSGDDLITGGAGADMLTGGSAKDVFVYLDASDSTFESWDRITDFTQGQDKIDLAALLGSTDLAWGNTTATANGAWYQNSGSSTFVFADTNGDSTADLKIELKHTPGLNLTVDDFIGVSASNALFTENDDIVNFNTVVAGTYTAGTQYNALGGNDMVTLPADAAAALAAGYVATQTFHGGAGNDTIFGGGLDDIVDGGEGNDVISGGAGHDTIFGGGGDDEITMLVTPGDVDTIDAGQGNDTLFLSGNAGGVVEVDLSAPDQVVSIGGVPDAFEQTNFENLDASGLGAGGSLLVNSTLANAVIVGSSGIDTIFAFGANSTVSGGPGNDMIFVTTGNNVLAGGPGNDQFLGGVGDDVYKFAFTLNSTVSSDDGFDEIFNFGVGDPFADNGSDKMRFDFTAVDGWDAGFADNAAKLVFLEDFFNVTNPASGGTRVSLQDGTGADTWSVTVDASLAAAFGVVDIYVNDVLIG